VPLGEARRQSWSITRTSARSPPPVLRPQPASAGACAAEMKKYDDCMEKHLGGRTTSTYKAPDSYVKR